MRMPAFARAALDRAKTALFDAAAKATAPIKGESLESLTTLPKYTSDRVGNRSIYSPKSDEGNPAWRRRMLRHA